MDLFLDIETIPTQRADVISNIRAEVEAKAAAEAESIRRQYKKPETVEAHLAELHASVPSRVEEAHRKTALDGGFGEVLCIGFAFDDQPAQTLIRTPKESERDLIAKFVSKLPEATMTALHWIGHGISTFDIRFLWQRCLVLGLPPAPLPQDDFDLLLTDTMIVWAGRFNRERWPSLERLCQVFGLQSPKTELDGGRVWDFTQAGRYKEISSYCARDVEAVRQVYRAMRPGGYPR